MREDYLPSLKELQLIADYPDEYLCLEIIWKHRKPDECPKCHTKNAKFSYIEGRKCWSCHRCGWHVSPLANTIFHKSHTSLTSWFKAIHLIYTSSGAVAALEIQRQCHVSYKTAWRLKNSICNYLNIQKSYSYAYSSVKKPIPPRRVKRMLQ